MPELKQIICAFEQMCGEGKPSALATVISVEGSSYRRPGARMLIAEDGRSWGGVSGGCLEQDVIRRARGVIATGTPVVCRYDTTDDEDDLTRGMGLGCRGVIDLFIEPLSRSSPGVMPAIRAVLKDRRPAAVATVVRAAGILRECLGRHLCLPDLDQAKDPIRDSGLNPAIEADLRDALSAGRTSMVHYQLQGGQADVFVQHVPPPQSLVICGSGPDAVPLLELATTLGWHVTVIASSSALGARERFAAADLLHLTDSENPLAGVVIEADAAVVLMNHSYGRDLAVLRDLAARSVRYLGILGPRQRTRRMLAELPEVPSHWNLFAPVGIDLGAKTPEQIALAVVAEIQLVLSGAAGGSMRDRPGPIHACAQAGTEARAPDSGRRHEGSTCLA